MHCRVVEQQLDAGLKPYANAKSLGQQQLMKLQVRQPSMLAAYLFLLVLQQ
jgi:hypothetical protein